MIDSLIKNDDVEIKWNTNFKEEIPNKIKLIPQFTPIGLKKTKLTFNEIKNILEV